MSDDERDLRARPAYGEYASAEEQRSRIRQPDASAALEAGVAPAEVVAPRPVFGQTTYPGAAAPHEHPRRTADRIVTIGLLAYGLINVVVSAFSLVDFPTLAATSMQIMGISGEFTNVAQGRMLGAAAAVTLAVGLIVTALGAWRRLRAGRTAWWVPLVGAVVTWIAVYALLIPALLGDPAFMGYVQSTTP